MTIHSISYFLPNVPVIFQNLHFDRKSSGNHHGSICYVHKLTLTSCFSERKYSVLGILLPNAKPYWLKLSISLLALSICFAFTDTRDNNIRIKCPISCIRAKGSKRKHVFTWNGTLATIVLKYIKIRETPIILIETYITC